ncbi:MAG TPA: DedA family protein [Candidatus Eisenbacteria bacterium]|nr:DedA family protein [Candidatus Eisenbacteria bacterium]
MRAIKKLAKVRIEVKVEKKHIVTLWALALGFFAAAVLFLCVLLVEEYGGPRLGAMMFWLLGVVREQRYLALFAISYIAAFALPLPSISVLMASSFAARTGEFDLALVMLVGIAGTVAGDNLGYWLGRRYGEEFLRWLGLGRMLDSAEAKGLKERVRAHPVATVFWTRFTTAIASATNLFAGLVKLPYDTFLLYDILGESILVIVGCTIGALGGREWERLHKVFGGAGLALVGALAIAAILSWRGIRGYRSRRSA